MMSPLGHYYTLPLREPAMEMQMEERLQNEPSPFSKLSLRVSLERRLQNVVITIHFVTVGRSAVVQREDCLPSKGFGPEVQSSAACTSRPCLHGHVDQWGRSWAAFVGSLTRTYS